MKLATVRSELPRIAILTVCLAYLTAAFAVPGDLVREYASPNSGTDGYGYSLASDGTLIFVGAPEDDTQAANAGAVYVYDRNTTDPVRILYSPNPMADARFGHSVAVTDDGKLAIGAPSDSTEAAQSGMVYVFDAATGALLNTIPNPTPNAGDQFGAKVAAAGTNLLVGAPMDDSGATDAGMAYQFNPAVTDPILLIPSPVPVDNQHFGSALAWMPGRIFAGPGNVWAFDDATGTLLWASPARDVTGNPLDATTIAVVGNNVLAKDEARVSYHAIRSSVFVLDAQDGFMRGETHEEGYVPSLTAYGHAIASSNQNPVISNPAIYVWQLSVLDGADGDKLKTISCPYCAALASVGSDFAASATYPGTVSLYEGFPPPMPASTPANLAAQAQQNGPVTLTWTNVPDETGYVIGRRSASEPFAFVGTAPREATTYTDTSVIPGVVYTYAIKSVNWTGDSPLSNEATATVSPLPSQPTVLLNPDPASNARFGYCLSMDDRYIAVGCPGVYWYGDGCVYVYDASTLAQVWKFTNPDNEPDRNFGWSVSVSNNRLAVGALHGERAYLFDLRTGAVTRHFDNPFATDSRQFGYSIALHGNNLAAGTFGNNSVLYLLNSQRGTLTRTLFDPMSDSQFPMSIAFGGAYVAGTRTQAGGGGDGETVHFFSRKTGALASSIVGRAVAPLGSKFLVGGRDIAHVVNPRDGSVSVTMVPPTPTPYYMSQFGASVAASRQWAVVGDYAATNIANEAGAVFMYDARSGALLNTYVNPTPQTGDQFGWSLGANRSKFAAGAPQDDTAGTDAGAVYVFPR